MSLIWNACESEKEVSLIKQLEDKAESVGRNAADALVKMGESAVPELIEVLMRDDKKSLSSWLCCGDIRCNQINLTIMNIAA